MSVLLIALAAGVGFIVAYHTYGRWLGSKIFRLSASAVCPSERLEDGSDYVPTKKSIVFGHHFTSIAGTGPIVGPAIAVMWGWLPALLWVVFGSIFIGAVHDFGSLIVSMRNNGQTVGDVAGRLLNKRVRLLFLFVLFMALTIVLAIFGLVIAAVFRMYPAAIFPCVIQIPIAVGIGYWLHKQGVNLLIPSILALGVMYLTVAFGDWGPLHAFNTTAAGLPTIVWVMLLLVYSYVASVLPVWILLQPRDYINSLQLISALGLIVIGLIVASFVGGAPPVEGADRMPLEIFAPMVRWEPEAAPLIFPFLFITIACGAISGFHCLVSSGTSSKQLKSESDAKFVGYGSMLTEGFLATIVILACVAGIGLGVAAPYNPSLAFPSQSEGESPGLMVPFWGPDGNFRGMIVYQDGADQASYVDRWDDAVAYVGHKVSRSAPSLEEDGIILGGVDIEAETLTASLVGAAAYNTRYKSWTSANGLGAKVGAFVDGAANFLKSIGIPGSIAVALMGVLVASFAGTTLDTACRLQRYVVQEIASTFAPRISMTAAAAEAHDFDDNLEGADRKTGEAADHQPHLLNPLYWLTNKHGATIFAIVIAAAMAAMPAPGADWSWKTAGAGGLILWPMFGATNQLLGGLAFMVIAFYLWRRKKPIWFLVLPLVFMLIMPAWAMGYLLFWGDQGWLYAEQKNWPLLIIAIATLVLEAWMIVEAVLLVPKVKGVLEPALPGITSEEHALAEA